MQTYQYKNTRFKARLEARYAKFFDLIGWSWTYQPNKLEHWAPNFQVLFPCTHTECNGLHSLLVDVRPYHDLEEFDGHVSKEIYFNSWGSGYTCDGILLAGIDPLISKWSMSHGSGGGEFDFKFWLGGVETVARHWGKCDNLFFRTA